MKTLNKALLIAIMTTILGANYASAQSAPAATPQKTATSDTAEIIIPTIYFDELSAKPAAKQNPLYILVQTEGANNNTLRGLGLGDKPMIRLYAEGGNKNVAGFIWTNYNPTTGQDVEVDLGITYTGRVHLGETKKSKEISLSMTPKLIYFIFPNSTSVDTKVLGFTAATSGLPVDLTFDAKKAFSVTSENGFYANWSISKTIPLAKNITTTLTAEVEHNEHFFVNSTGINYGAGTVKVNYTPTPAFTLTASATGIKKIDPTSEYVKDNSIFKATATYTFK